NFLLLMYAYRLSRGRPCRQGAGAQSAALRAVCKLLPPPDRRPGVASRGNDAAVRAAPDLPAATGELRHGTRVPSDRACKEGAAGRQLGTARGRPVRLAREGFGPCVRGVARR